MFGGKLIQCVSPTIPRSRISSVAREMWLSVFKTRMLETYVCACGSKRTTDLSGPTTPKSLESARNSQAKKYNYAPWISAKIMVPCVSSYTWWVNASITWPTTSTLSPVCMLPENLRSVIRPPVGRRGTTRNVRPRRLRLSRMSSSNSCNGLGDDLSSVPTKTPLEFHAIS